LGVVFLNQDVTGQLSKPRDPWRYNQQNTNDGYNKPCDDESFSEARQWIHGSDTNDYGSFDTKNMKICRSCQGSKRLSLV
jgi:hypothetical protein